MGRLLRSHDLQRLHGSLREFSKGVVILQSEVAGLLGALSASPEVRLDPAKVQQEVHKAFKAAQKQAARLPSTHACSAACAAATPFSSSKVPLQPLHQADSGTGSSPIAACGLDRMAAQGAPCDFGAAPFEQTSSWAHTAWRLDSSGVGGLAGSHYSSSSSAAELHGSAFQQPSPSASLYGLAPAAGDEELPQVWLDCLGWGLPVLVG